MRYLLDANMITDLIRQPHGRIANRLAVAGEAQICTSIIVAAELRFGVAKEGGARFAALVAGALGRMTVLAFEPPADIEYGRIRAALERAGRPIGGNDTLIAAHAVAEGCVLVTANVREFGRVEGLAVENWLAD